jgi:hypothetical protein
MAIDCREMFLAVHLQRSGLLGPTSTEMDILFAIGVPVTEDGDFVECRPVEEFHGLYSVSREGWIWSFKRRNFMMPVYYSTLSSSYPRVTLTRPKEAGVVRTVHTIVAKAWVPNPDNKPFVNHKDGNKGNYHADNLEWVTNSENQLHAVRTGLRNMHPYPRQKAAARRNLNRAYDAIRKFSEDEIREIRAMGDAYQISQKEIGKKYGVRKSSISKIILRQAYGWVK